MFIIFPPRLGADDVKWHPKHLQNFSVNLFSTQKNLSGSAQKVSKKSSIWSSKSIENAPKTLLEFNVLK